MGKALIIYTSITNNTQEIAFVIGKVLEAHNFTVDYAKVLPKYKGGEIRTYYPEDYDVLAIGCPIIAALPYINFNSAVGDQDDYKTRNVRFLRRENREKRNRYGIAFTTYGGTGNAPANASVPSRSKRAICVPTASLPLRNMPAPAKSFATTP